MCPKGPNRHARNRENRREEDEPALFTLGEARKALDILLYCTDIMRVRKRDKVWLEHGRLLLDFEDLDGRARVVFRTRTATLTRLKWGKNLEVDSHCRCMAGTLVRLQTGDGSDAEKRLLMDYVRAVEVLRECGVLQRWRLRRGSAKQ